MKTIFWEKSSVKEPGAKRSIIRAALWGNGKLAVWLCVIALTLGVVCLSLEVASSQAGSEQQLVDILKSGASPQEKDAACAELKRAGTARSVPALAALLGDPDLSHSARLALESLPYPEAGAALVEALDKTTGQLKAGIIHSLGLRRESRATPALIKLLDDADPKLARAAATALGRIGGAPAVAALRAAFPHKKMGGPREAICDALLTAANRDLAEGRKDDANRVFLELRTAQVPDHIRSAAYRGLILCSSPGRAVELVKTALRNENGPDQIAAIEASRALNMPELTGILCEAAAAAAPPLETALIEALRQRGDPAAAPSLAAWVKAPDAAVRLAAIAGLGELGNDTAVGVLLDASGSSDEVEMRAGRQALLVLKRGNVTQALVENLTAGRPRSRMEAARALAGRGDTEAAESLIIAARSNSDPVRGAVFSALGQLAGAKDVPALVSLVVEAKDETARDQAREALGAACARLQAESVPEAATAIATALPGAGPEGRGALLQTGSTLRDERLRVELRRALGDPDPGLRQAAARALFETRDPGLLPDILKYARQASDPAQRVPAIRGYIRLATDAESVKLTVAERVNALQEVLPLTRT